MALCTIAKLTSFTGRLQLDANPLQHPSQMVLDAAFNSPADDLVSDSDAESFHGPNCHRQIPPAIRMDMQSTHPKRHLHAPILICSYLYIFINETGFLSLSMTTIIILALVSSFQFFAMTDLFI